MTADSWVVRTVVQLVFLMAAWKAETLDCGMVVQMVENSGEPKVAQMVEM